MISATGFGFCLLKVNVQVTFELCYGDLNLGYEVGVHADAKLGIVDIMRENRDG